MRIIVTERIAEEGIDFLRENGVEVDVKYGISRDELLGIIDAYDAIIVRSVTKVNQELLGKGARLRVVGRAGNGIDNIDVPFCTQKGIIVVNTPESNTMAAAELAIGLSYCLFRNIPKVHAAVKNLDFRRNIYIGNELDGKVVGIIGLGRIGSIVARKMIGSNMKAIAYDPYITDEKFLRTGVAKCETLEELLKQSDLITIHTPKTAETYGMVGEEELKICKKGVRIVNAARGGLINEKALYEALKSGQVAGAAIDVLDPEPSYDLPPEKQTFKNPLLELDNVVITPHLGASTREANFNVGTAITKLVAEALQGKMVSAVNMPPLKGGDLQQLRPYIELAEMLGKIYYQAEKERIEKLEIVFSGDLAEKETRVLSLSVLKGFLGPVVEEKVNYVNAELIAERMGIELIESRSSHLDKYTNLLTVKFYTKNKEMSISGTVFAKEELRIVDFFGYKLDFEPSPNVIAIQNIDRPGIIGRIGTILGENDINIAAMQWSRNRRGEKAVSFVSVDVEVSNDVLTQLREMEGLLKVSMLKL
ncbi:MAG: phosphoglycerate dehydrogenase [Acidobacteriota bacterium]|jgi:D-3-phosphoglycerate dehydrogenase